MRKIKQITSIAVIAALIIGCSGCEKKAQTIEGFEETTEKTDNSTAINDSSDKVDNSSDTMFVLDDGVEVTERWDETLEGGPDGFDSINISMDLKDYSKEELETTVLEYEEFDSDFAKRMCETVFDSGKADVYDYSKKTKRLCEDQIRVYEDALKLYDFYTDNGMDEAFEFYPSEIVAAGLSTGWIMEQPGEKMQRSEIEEDIDRLSKEKEEAPESIDNNYTYGGYIGKIDGEEYYMYFGNRNYDEYVNSRATSQYNGRVVTIMKSDLDSSFAGKVSAYVVDGNVNLEDIDTADLVPEMIEYDNTDPQFKLNALVNDPDHFGVENDISQIDISEDMIDKAEAFLDKLGYGDGTYIQEGYERLTWSNEVSNEFIYANGYHMSSYSYMCQDGFIISFGLKPSRTIGITKGEVKIPDYVESGDTFEYDSYIEVYVNSTGILGCQIYNPTRVMKSDSISGIIDNEAVKEIVKESVDDKSLWNMPIGRTIKLFDLSCIRLLSFPIKSEKNSNEYTLIPCYIVFQPIGSSMGNVDNPFLLINAIDGSIIKVENELEDYPKGWDNGNIGYGSLLSGQWERNNIKE